MKMQMFHIMVYDLNKGNLCMSKIILFLEFFYVKSDLSMIANIIKTYIFIAWRCTSSKVIESHIRSLIFEITLFYRSFFMNKIWSYQNFERMLRLKRCKFYIEWSSEACGLMGHMPLPIQNRGGICHFLICPPWNLK